MNYTDLSEKSFHDENSNHWFTKDRSETSSNRVGEKYLDNGILVENFALTRLPYLTSVDTGPGGGNMML